MTEETNTELGIMNYEKADGQKQESEETEEEQRQRFEDLKARMTRTS